MVLLIRDSDMEDAMPQTVPSAGFTPPCDYSNFAENFDLSLLPGGEQLSPSTQLYANTLVQKTVQPKILTTFYPNSPQEETNTDSNIDLGPDFQKLLGNQENKIPPAEALFLDTSTNKNQNLQQSSQLGNNSGNLSPFSQGLLSPNDQFGNYRQSADANFYPSSPEISLYTPSPNSVYSQSPREDYTRLATYIKQENQYTSTSPLPSYSPYRIKEENFLSPCGFSSPTSPATSYSSLSSPEQIQFHHGEADVLDLLENTVLDKQIKQESTVDFTSILKGIQDTENYSNLFPNCYKTESKPCIDTTPKDHQLLRQVLRDTSFQKKFNIKTFDFALLTTEIKMEEPESSDQRDLIRTCKEQLAGENIEPVLNMAIEQMRKDVDSTCAALGISPDPAKWSSANVLSWIQWTSRQFGFPEPIPEQWDIPGATLTTMSEEDFTRRATQGGMILHAQLEIWKAAYSEENMSMSWLPETTSSNASSGDVSDDEDEETPSPVDPAKPTTSRAGGTHIHLWQFLKELLASPQTHGSCIRWLDRSKGIFKIEDSVKVARLWGKRKNRPAMNYDKLSRSIRQYYKKGIMKKTERSQRLVYQFCHPYNL